MADTDPQQPPRQQFRRGERTANLAQLRGIASDVVEVLTGEKPQEWGIGRARVSSKLQMAARFDASTEGELISEAMEVYRATRYVDGSYLAGDPEMGMRQPKAREYSSHEEMRLLDAAVGRLSVAVAACRGQLKDFAGEVTEGSRLSKQLKACRREMRDVAQQVEQMGELMDTMQTVARFRRGRESGGGERSR